MNKFAEINSNKNPADMVPHSIEAEQQLLGGILNNNDLFYSLEVCWLISLEDCFF